MSKAFFSMKKKVRCGTNGCTKVNLHSGLCSVTLFPKTRKRNCKQLETKITEPHLLFEPSTSFSTSRIGIMYQAIIPVCDGSVDDRIDYISSLERL